MKLFIPELGTKLKLTQDWTFNLYIERRNSDLLIPEDEKSELNKEYRKLNKEVKELDRKAWKEEIPSGRSFYEYKFMMEVSPSYRKAEGLRKQASKIYGQLRPFGYSQGGYKSKEYTINKDTILEVDRIYIRQGNQAYSSITFKIRNKKVLRFWAKLDDVNNIECEVVNEPISSNRKKSIPRCSIGG